MSAGAPVRYTVQDGVAHVRLDRPGSHNALDLALVRALFAAVERASTDEHVRVLLLSGEGPSFCVGGDVRGMAAAPDPGQMVRELASASHEAILALDALEKAVVLAAHGNVAGAGLGYCCAADLVVAAKSTRFLSAFTAVGLTPDSGTSWLLARSIGLHRALELTLLNTALDAERACDWGLVARVVPDEDVLAEAMSLARSLAAGPGAAYGRTRRLIREAWGVDLVTHLAREAGSIGELAGSADAQRLIADFARKG